MKKITIIMLVLLLFTTLLVYSEDLETIEIKADKKILELLNTWDKDIWFFTSEKNPIETLDNLKKEDFACWGAELIQNVLAFLDAAGVKYEDKGIYILGTGNPIFSGMENPPKLFITWSKYAEHLDGSVRVIFIEKDS